MTTIKAGDPIARSGLLTDWLLSEGLDPYRIYQLDIDGHEATVYEYVMKGGQPALDASGRDVKRRKPYTVTLKTKPPKETP